MPSILPQPPHISVSDDSGVSVRVDTVGRVLVDLGARGLQVFVGPSALQRSPLLTSIASSAKPWEVLSLPVGEDAICAWLEMVNDRQLECRCVASEEQLLWALTVRFSPQYYPRLCLFITALTECNFRYDCILRTSLRPPAQRTRLEQLETQAA